MSEAAFTPGPWYVPHFADDAHSCNCTSIVSECYAGSVADISINNGLSIGNGGNDAPQLKEAAANARLIAAAPDLFAALAELDQLLGFTDDTGFDRDMCDAMLRAAAALAKARGE